MRLQFKPWSFAERVPKKVLRTHSAIASLSRFLHTHSEIVNKEKTPIRVPKTPNRIAAPALDTHWPAKNVLRNADNRPHASDCHKAISGERPICIDEQSHNYIQSKAPALTNPKQSIPSPNCMPALILSGPGFCA